MELFIADYGWVMTTVGVYYGLNIAVMVVGIFAKMADL